MDYRRSATRALEAPQGEQDLAALAYALLWIGELIADNTTAIREAQGRGRYPSGPFRVTGFEPNE